MRSTSESDDGGEGEGGAGLESVVVAFGLQLVVGPLRLVIRSGSKAYRLGFGLPWGWGAVEAAL